MQLKQRFSSSQVFFTFVGVRIQKSLVAQALRLQSPYTGVSTPPSPEIPKKSQKGLPGPPGPECQKVSKKSPNIDSVVLMTLFRVILDFSTLFLTLRPEGLGSPFLRRFLGFRHSSLADSQHSGLRTSKHAIESEQEQKLSWPVTRFESEALASALASDCLKNCPVCVEEAGSRAANWRKKGDRQPGVMHVDLAAFEASADGNSIVSCLVAPVAIEIDKESKLLPIFVPMQKKDSVCALALRRRRPI